MKKYGIFFVVFMYLQTAFSQDFAYDKKIGDESARQVEMLVGIYPDSVLNAYVNAVGERLVGALGQSPFAFQFKVVDMAEPNAFALPGGHIYISRGLLALVNEEADLAGVMGHEMIHVTKRHSIKQMKKSILPSLLMIPGALVGGLVNEDLGNIINAPLALGSELFLTNYSRKQERESDLYGVELASEAGYDPSRLGIILQNLSREMEIISGEAEKRSYFSSHPYTPKRIEDLDKRIASLIWKPDVPVANTQSELYGYLEGMHIGPNPAQGIFREGQFLHPDLNLFVRFPDDWKTINVPVAVGATQENGEGQVLLTLEKNFTTADSAANAFIKSFSQAYGIKPLRNDSIRINEFPARIVSFRDNTGEQPVLLYAYWIQHNQTLLNLIGLSTMKYESMVQSAAESIRNLTTEEKESISGWKLRSEKAIAGETIADFCRRTGNMWNAERTALMNGINVEEPLRDEQVLKIAVDSPYF
ncbi:MAG: M48 family metalloprotease [Bacteroidetes bacterium]|nr:M48 family metalloprotease [Bacteroidota bacterium]